ncbi:DUF5684 domain-containing protein [Candidatus Weimeria sp. HCP3S3_B5]|uniref:DUF5684 domain-containing protein n=1 Tax=Candidatus Weimeria sp. HCP3S3_B5 TaxID=3438871 RepID=UPI0030470007|nr:DUF5684 domain-containing protein [Lachnospiraceae bacterium]
MEGLFALLAVYWVWCLVLYILLIIANWKIFEKAGEPGWASLIPFYNLYVQYKIAWGNGLLFLLLLIPIVNVVISIIYEVKLAHAFGKSGGFAVGLIFLPNIFQLILGFDSSQYYGPQ